jgi:hypothetical protein
MGLKSRVFGANLEAFDEAISSYGWWWWWLVGCVVGGKGGGEGRRDLAHRSCARTGVENRTTQVKCRGSMGDQNPNTGSRP